MSRAGAFAALATLCALVALFGYALSNRHDPSAVPSALIGKPLSPFSLPPVEGRLKPVTPDGLALADLTQGQVSVVNVFASWCTTCRLETPHLQTLGSRHDITLYGLDWKDEPKKAAAFLDELGDPFGRVGSDRSGRTAIDWGVYGVPETFVIDPKGRVVARFAGALTEEAMARVIEPAIAASRKP